MKSAQPHARGKARAAASARTRPSRERASRAPMEPAEFAPRAAQAPSPTLHWTYIAACAIAALWTLGLFVATAPLHRSGFALLLTALLSIGPTALLLSLAYLVRQGDRLAEASSGPDDQGVAMLGPALRAAAGAGHAADAVQSGLTEAAAAANGARGDLDSLRRDLSEAGGPAPLVADLVGAGRSSLARRLKTEGRDMAARSEALDAQLAQAAEVIDLHVRRTADAAAAAAARFAEADKSLQASTARLRPAAEEAGAALRKAGRQVERQAEQLEAAGPAAAAKVEASGRLMGQGEGLLSSLEARRAARQEFIALIRAQAEALQALVGRAAEAARDIAARAVAAGQSLGEAAMAKSRAPGPSPAPAIDGPPADAPALEVSFPAPADPSQGLRLARPAQPADAEVRGAAPVLTARGIGGQIIFDGTLVLIDRTQSTSFVMHGAGGQRSIRLGEVVKVRFTPPRRGAHGYLQFVLSRGHEGRGGPADVNSILFDASQQASFKQMADVLQRAVRHLRRHPDATDPRAPGELAYLMDLRGRGLIDAREFADATARLETQKPGRPAWFRRKSPS
jgi:hypothetical protein